MRVLRQTVRYWCPVLVSMLVVAALGVGEIQLEAAQALLAPQPASADARVAESLVRTPIAATRDLVAIALCPPSMGFGETIQCSIDAAAEMDSYSFAANAGDKVLVRVSRTSGDLWPGIRVYSPGPDATKLCDASSPTTAEIASCTLPSTGTHTILVYDGFNGTHTGDYNLYLTRP